MAAASQVTGKHGDDRLLKSAAEIIALKDERRTTLCGAQV